MNRRSKLLLCLLALLGLNAAAVAEVALPSLFSEGMVLQRNLPIHIWGKAAPAENVTVTFRTETRSAMADDLGRWEVFLSPVAAGGPFELAVRGTNAIILHNVLMGDVWVASGQSNMEFRMRELDNAPAEIAVAKFPRIHFLRVKRTYSEYPLPDATLDQPWSECGPESVREFSAVAYYFAREIQEKEKVPIGIIESAWGGTVAEAWTSLHALSSDPALMPVFAARARMMDDYSKYLLLQQKQQAAEEMARAAGTTPPTPISWRPNPPMWAPAELYNAMIAPLTPYSIRGVIWYQGESNSKLDRAPIYERLFQTLIEDWRAQWAQGDLPFLYVQISAFKSTAEEDWPTIREAQRRALILRNTAMAVTIDIGDPGDVHPKNKRDVGHRLALAARATVYGESIEYSGPLFRQATAEGQTLRVWFDHATSLQAKGGPLTGFEVAGPDGKFVPAQARIDGTTVLVSSPAVPSPVSVRYGWANSPECNLFNQEGQPASPFRSDR